MWSSTPGMTQHEVPISIPHALSGNYAAVAWKVTDNPTLLFKYKQIGLMFRMRDTVGT